MQLLARRIFACGILFSSILGVGCSDDTGSRSTISGKVTWDGKPVPEGTITFVPKGSGKLTSALINSDGTYQVGEKLASSPGEYIVTIDAQKTQDVAATAAKSFDEEAKLMARDARASSGKSEWHVPQDYAAEMTTPIKPVTLKAGVNVVDFNLPQ